MRWCKRKEQRTISGVPVVEKQRECDRDYRMIVKPDPERKGLWKWAVLNISWPEASDFEQFLDLIPRQEGVEPSRGEAEQAARYARTAMMAPWETVTP